MNGFNSRHKFKYVFANILVFILVLQTSFVASDTDVIVENGKSGMSNSHKKYEKSFVSVNFARVGQPIVVSLWIFMVCISITAFHYMERISNIIPESCLLILLGLPIGAIYKYGKSPDDPQYFEFTPDLFFLYLLPPIVLDAGYFVKSRTFFENILPILLHAIIGTLFNTFALGYFLYLCRGTFILNEIKLLQCFLFGSLISAVDPVAVLAVFNELQVHQLLFIIVFGESILNDAVTVVLYNLFEYLVGVPTITHKEILLGIGSFFVVSGCGIVIGVFFGILTAFITKFTKRFRLLEPVVVLVMPYIGYLIAEVFHFSGILSILFCAIVMRPFVEINVSYKSKVTIQRILRAISTTTEAIIFIFLGVALITADLFWDTSFAFLTLFGITIFRIISILTITAITNASKPREKVSWVEQFVMMYGGLRGAVAISLALILEDDHKYKKLFLTTTFFVVLFTIFVQGVTIKPLVHFLKIKIEPNKKLNMLEEMTLKMIDCLNLSAHTICSSRHLTRLRKWGNKTEVEFTNYLTNQSKVTRKDSILQANTDILYKEAAKLVKTNPSAIINITKSQAFNLNKDSKVVLQDVPTLDPKAQLRIHQSNLNKGQNLFETYVKNQALDRNKNLVSIGSDVNFMTRNESFHGPGATFTKIGKTPKRPNKKRSSALQYERVKKNNLQVPQSSRNQVKVIQNDEIPLVVLNDMPMPLFTIGEEDYSPIQSITLKEISESVQLPIPKSASKKGIHTLLKEESKDTEQSSMEDTLSDENDNINDIRKSQEEI